MSPTSYRAAPPRGDGCTVPQPLGLVNQTSHASGRLLRLLRARRRRLRLGRRGGRAGPADTELVHRGVVELTARRQAFLGLVIADRGRRAGAHHAIDRAGVVALIAQRLLRGPNIRPLALGRALVLLALHLVANLVILGASSAAARTSTHAGSSSSGISVGHGQPRDAATEVLHVSKPGKISSLFRADRRAARRERAPVDRPGRRALRRDSRSPR